jgi:hypothetical protein
MSLNFPRFSWAVAGSLAAAMLLAGCESKVATLTPEVQAGMLKDLQSGKLALDCGMKCSFTFINRAAQLQALDIAERWNDLAEQTMQIGFGNDLAYYYLGQSAQGLGYHQAAIDYYNYSYALAQGTDSSLRCEGQDSCQGVDIANSIPVLVQASKQALAQQEAAEAAAAAPPPVVHHHHKPKPSSNWVAPPPASASSTGSGGSTWAAPPPPAAGAAAPTQP